MSMPAVLRDGPRSGRIAFLLAVVAAVTVVGAWSRGVLHAASRRPVPRLALVANLRSDNLSVFRVDARTGRLQPAEGSPVSVGRKPTCVAASPDGRFVYVANELGGTISAFRVDRAGRLQPLPGSPFPVAASPRACAVDAAGAFLYVASAGASQSVTALAIDSSNGSLRTLSTVPLPRSANPMAVALDAPGTLLFTANYTQSSVSLFTRNAVVGTLAGLADSPFGCGRYPQCLAPHPNGRFVYACGASPEVAGLAVSADQTRLVPLPGSPWMVGRQCSAMVVEPAGRFAYACDFMSGELHGMQVDVDTGVLSPLAGFPLATGENSLRSLALDAEGRCLYAINSYNSHVVGYRMDAATGALVPVGGEMPVAEDGATSIIVIPTP